MKWFYDLMFLAGVCLIIAGIWRVSMAAGMIAAGVAVMVIGGGLADGAADAGKDEKNDS